MALFGKKAKDSGSDVPAVDTAGEDEGGVAVAVEDAPAPGKKVKAARAPKAPKSSTVKNGVAVGLNIGNQFIKAVEVTSKGGELTVTAMGAVPTPPESYTNGNVLSVSALSGAIRQLWKSAGIKSKVAVTSVAGTGALVVRVIEVPKMSDGELGDNMKVDADRYIPFPPSEVVMDFKALRELPSDPDAPNMEVLLAAAQREIIDLHIQVIQKAKLDPRAIDVEPIALARAMQLERRGDGNSGYIDYNEVTALVNLGATGTEISILRGDILVFTRVVPGGGNAITAAIAEGMGLPFGDAERVKIDSADAIAPAGYNAGGGDFGFGGEGDFDFGGGGDLNAAFDDISANPQAASDDPFDLDFFNQTPQDEPGAGHAQKEGEPGEAPNAFNFDDFNFDAPPAKPEATPPAASTPDTTPPASGEPVSFSFGFDDLNEAALPSVETAPTPMEDSTSKLEETPLSATPVTTTPVTTTPVTTTPVTTTPVTTTPVTTTPAAPTVAPDFATSSGSAFDFDNFDLPTATPEARTVSIPIEPAPVKAVPAPTSAASSFDLGVPLAPPTPTTPISFDLEDENLASKAAPADSAPATASFAAPTPEEPITPVDDAPIVDVPVANVPAADPFSFTMGEPVAVAPVVTPPIAVPPLEMASMDATPAETTFAPPSAPEAATPARTAPAGDEFDLDAIFGSPAVTPVAATPVATVSGTPPTVNLQKDPVADSGMDLGDDFGAAAALPIAASGATPGVPVGSDDFDLSGIDTGGADSFGAGFGQTDDFTDFGAGLGASGAAADAAALYGLISPSLEELAGEVRRSLEFHLGRYPDATISRLVLLGGGARLRNLDVFLTQMIGVPTAVGNPFAHLTIRTPKLAPNYSSENGPLCSVALGLALRDFVD